ncbi:T9SS type A sorting domain-containing protein [candidate division WOR-3 bacterium]|uniref:T9SS type A sorting domain-containing protein n=1 Tax=candidate division WOR-3 bacterium TaxID=2052148 RepID=A0A938BTM2_UNCW3|nr:T9SS type A sorting domain-containing protein [candidate division WOR-3 bacterium]
MRYTIVLPQGRTGQRAPELRRPADGIGATALPRTRRSRIACRRKGTEKGPRLEANMPSRTVVVVLTLALCAAVVPGTPSPIVGRPVEGLPSTLDVVTEIVRPDTYEAPGLIPVQVRLTNTGDTTARVPYIIVKIVPSGYRDSSGYVTVGVGENKVVTLNPWVSAVSSHETCTAWITYPADSNHSNDTDVVFIRTASGLDVAAEIVSPTDSEEPGLVPVQIRLINMFVVPAAVPRLDVKMVPSGYSDSTMNIFVAVGESTVVTLDPWVYSGGNETCKAYITYPADTYRPNDTDIVFVSVAGISGWVQIEHHVGMSLTLSPSPLAGSVLHVDYGLRRAGPARITLLDVSGRPVVTRRFLADRTGDLPLDLRLLRGGVYLVRLDDGQSAVTQKFVVQR